jgi:hypothetical protein
MNIVSDEVSEERMSACGAAEDAVAVSRGIVWAFDDLPEHVIEDIGRFVDCELGRFAEIFGGSAFLGGEGIEDHSHEGEEAEESDDDDKGGATSAGSADVGGMGIEVNLEFHIAESFVIGQGPPVSEEGWNTGNAGFVAELSLYP